MIFRLSHFVTAKYSSNMTAWFYTQSNDIIASHAQQQLQNVLLLT